MSLEEVMKAAKGVSNMVLAHEIAVDKNFKLEKFDPPDNSVEKQVRQFSTYLCVRSNHIDTIHTN